MLFARHCESCHQARLVADEPRTRISSARWEELILAGGRIVWADDRRHRTGVEPDVHPDGARTPSLRRLWAKWPCFTHGSASDVEMLLTRMLVGDTSAHDGASRPGQRRLDADGRAVLSALVDLL